MGQRDGASTAVPLDVDIARAEASAERNRMPRVTSHAVLREEDGHDPHCDCGVRHGS